MRDPFAGYDQWKTASPWDDEPEIDDIVAETDMLINDIDSRNVPGPSSSMEIKLFEKLTKTKQGYDTTNALHPAFPNTC